MKNKMVFRFENDVKVIEFIVDPNANIKSILSTVDDFLRSSGVEVEGTLSFVAFDNFEDYIIDKDDIDLDNEKARQLYTDFKVFLTQNNALEEFKKETRRAENFKNFNDLINNTNPFNYIDEAFMWNETEKGFCFWNDLHLNWKKYLEKQGYKE